MKYIAILLVFLLNANLYGQEATYFHNGAHHYLVDGIDVSEQSPSVLLGDAIMFEYDSKIYLVENTTSLENANETVAAVLVDDRTKLKNWGIDFYVERNGLLITYFDGNFQNPESLFLGPDGQAYGYGGGRYFKLHNYNDRKENMFEEILTFSDGLWWRDESGQLFALRNGAQFQGSVEPTSKGFIALDEQTGESLWFSLYSNEIEANVVYTIDLLTDGFALNVSTRDGFIAIPHYKGKRLSNQGDELEMDNGRAIYFYDADLDKSFVGYYPDGGQVMPLVELEVPFSASEAYWIKDNEGETYLQIQGSLWEADVLKGLGGYFGEVNGLSFEFPNYEQVEAMKLYPANVLD